ncbi:hypothetical protein [Pseudomonas gingeri]|uniref:hypothetical protein n=1 Tax=Pseudomonas gingeri TaxID=117681 RepID=UPI0015A4281A|nr:hypothetical protein [Pseudomonas gingeri]NWD08951.1 hypothetical protein [Pseudomonas gingeri]NWE34782.1 hypothetical protein [Pseudomonas gingeri]NWE56883.1 hypothetical protein [Pseudomonas gingeri]NWF02022.1 hypothetical protein [Pseudomonas gingeri]
MTGFNRSLSTTQWLTFTVAVTIPFFRQDPFNFNVEISVSCNLYCYQDPAGFRPRTHLNLSGSPAHFSDSAIFKLMIQALATRAGPYLKSPNQGKKMNDSLADLDALALRCRAERSREYIAESIQCYKAGAYRSAIVNTWIAVVFDLVDKIRDLALTNDPIASRINTRYETYITQINAGNDQGVKNALEFERTIINTCGRELEFFDHQQMRDLERLREDRHQCAHPSFQRAGVPHRPTAELARLHLRNAVEHVLSKPPIQGRTAIVELLTTIASEYFPKDHHQAAIALQQTPLANPSEALIRGVIDMLVFGYAQPGSPVFDRIQVGAVLSVLLETQRAISEPRIAQQVSTLIRQVTDAGLPSIARLVAATPEIVGLIDDAARVRLGEFLRVGPEGDVLPAMAGLGRNELLRTVVQNRIPTLAIDRLGLAIQEYGLGLLAKSHAMALLSQSRNWTTTNDLFETLVIPLFGSLTRAEIEQIIRMPRETGADLPGANMYSLFINQVSRLGVIPDAELDQLLNENRAEFLVLYRQRERELAAQA